MKPNQVNIKNRRATFDYEIGDTFTAGIEIAKLQKAYDDTGFTIVPMRIFISERGYAKLVIGIGRGKKQYDKRQSIKEREDKRSIDRMFKK